MSIQSPNAALTDSVSKRAVIRPQSRHWISCRGEPVSDGTHSDGFGVGDEVDMVVSPGPFQMASPRIRFGKKWAEESMWFTENLR